MDFKGSYGSEDQVLVRRRCFLGKLRWRAAAVAVKPVRGWPRAQSVIFQRAARPGESNQGFASVDEVHGISGCCGDGDE